MTTRESAIYEFMNGFGIPAYPASSTPDEAPYPYLTYSLVISDFVSGEVPIEVNVWYYTDSESIPNAKVREIEEVIGRGGRMVPFDGGAVWIKKGDPWCQSLSDDNHSVKRRYLNMSLEYITL